MHSLRQFPSAGAQRADQGLCDHHQDTRGLRARHSHRRRSRIAGTLRRGLERHLGAESTPKEAIAKLNAAAVRALADPELRQRITDLALEMPPADQLTPEALTALQKAEIEKWWPIIEAAGIKKAD